VLSKCCGFYPHWSPSKIGSLKRKKNLTEKLTPFKDFKCSMSIYFFISFNKFSKIKDFNGSNFLSFSYVHYFIVCLFIYSFYPKSFQKWYLQILLKKRHFCQFLTLCFKTRRDARWAHRRNFTPFPPPLRFWPKGGGGP